MTTALNVQGNCRPMISVMVMTHRKASVQWCGDSVNVDDEAMTDMFLCRKSEVECIFSLDVNSEEAVDFALTLDSKCTFLCLLSSQRSNSFFLSTVTLQPLVIESGFLMQFLTLLRWLLFNFIWTIISTQLFLPEYTAHREIYWLDTDLEFPNRATLQIIFCAFHFHTIKTVHTVQQTQQE